MNHRQKKKGRFLFVAAGIVLAVGLLRRKNDLGTAAGSVFNKALVAFFGFVNQYIPWHHLPPSLGALNLLGLRDVLRQQNLYDTFPPRSPDAKVIHCSVSSLSTRNSDGTCNDLQHPEMGSAMQRFGRNVPRQYTYPDKEPALLTPSPRIVSQRLLARKSFRPAESLNLLAAAWIQFQTHDWFSHERSKPGNEFKVPLDTNDDWPESPMRIQRTPLIPPVSRRSLTLRRLI